MDVNLNSPGQPQRDLTVDIDKFAAALEKQRRQAIQAGVEKEMARRRCRNCKYWDKWEHAPTCGTCMSPKVLSEGALWEDHDPVFIGNGGSTEMAPGMEYGCVHFEGKAEAEVERLADTVAFDRLEFLTFLIGATEPLIFCNYVSGASARLKLWPGASGEMDWVPVADKAEAAKIILDGIDAWNRDHSGDPQAAAPEDKIDLRRLTVATGCPDGRRTMMIAWDMGTIAIIEAPKQGKE